MREPQRPYGAHAPRTSDIDGKAKTADLGKAIAALV